MIIKKIVGMTMAVLLTIQPLAAYASTDSISVPKGFTPYPGEGGSIALDRAGDAYRNLYVIPFFHLLFHKSIIRHDKFTA